MKRGICYLALLCAWTGCSLFHRDDSHDQPRAAEHTLSDGGAPLGPDARSPSAGTRASARDVAAAAGGMTVDEPEVWIGQLLSDSSPLCDSVRGDQSASFASDAVDKTERLVIVLQPRAGGGWAGRIRIGTIEGQPPARTPPRAFIQGKGSVQGNRFWSCSIAQPTEGIEYTLLDVVRTSQALRFSISPNEYWDDWCRSTKFECPMALASECSHYPTCVCSGGECAADLRDRIYLQLTFTESTLEGRFVLFGSSSEMRLRRVK